MQKQISVLLNILVSILGTNRQIILLTLKSKKNLKGNSLSTERNFKNDKGNKYTKHKTRIHLLTIFYNKCR